MRRKEVLLAAVMGGVVGAFLTMAAGLVLPLEAEKQNDATFDTVTCKFLKVIRHDGEEVVSIGGGWSESGYIIVSGEDSKHGSVYMKGGWTGDLGGGETTRFGAELAVSGVRDRINIGGPIGINQWC